MARVVKSGTACFAEGGPVFSSRSVFMKAPDPNHGGKEPPQTYGKGGKGNSGQATGRANPTPKKKSETPFPR